jgi:hypothetical protein
MQRMNTNAIHQEVTVNECTEMPLSQVFLPISNFLIHQIKVILIIVLDIKHQSVTSETGEITAVIIDIETFRRIESIIEDYGLIHFMNEADLDDTLGHEEALKYLLSLDEVAENGSV